MNDVGKNLRSLERKVIRLEKENMSLKFRLEQVEILWRNSNDVVLKLMEELDESIMGSIDFQEKLDKFESEEKDKKLIRGVDYD